MSINIAHDDVFQPEEDLLLRPRVEFSDDERRRRRQVSAISQGGNHSTIVQDDDDDKQTHRRKEEDDENGNKLQENCCERLQVSICNEKLIIVQASAAAENKDDHEGDGFQTPKTPDRRISGIQVLECPPAPRKKPRSSIQIHPPSSRKRKTRTPSSGDPDHDHRRHGLIHISEEEFESLFRPPAFVVDDHDDLARKIINKVRGSTCRRQLLIPH